MRDFAIGFVLATILCGILLGITWVDCERRIRCTEVEMATKCEDDSNRARELGAERNRLWKEIGRLKRSM